jgi:hypothetical protein
MEVAAKSGIGDEENAGFWAGRVGWQRVECVPRIKNSCGQRETMGFGTPAGWLFSRAGEWGTQEARGGL